jgi:hypothetical protein
MSMTGYVRIKGKGIAYESGTLAYHDDAVFRRVAREQGVHDLYRFQVDEDALDRLARQALPDDLKGIYANDVHADEVRPNIPEFVRRFRRPGRTSADRFPIGHYLNKGKVKVSFWGDHVHQGWGRWGETFSYKSAAGARAAYHRRIKSLIRDGYVEDHPRKDAKERIEELLQVAFAAKRAQPDRRSERRYEQEIENQLNRLGKWFPARQGLKSVDALLKYFRKNREELDTAENKASPESALKDLQAIARILKKASASGEHFRLFFS